MSVTLVTGAIDSGKSRWMRERAELSGRVAWLSPKAFAGEAGGTVEGYDLLMLPDGNRIPLARVGTVPDDEGWFQFRRFIFNPAAFAAAEAAFAEFRRLRPVEFLLDEVGPLECEGRGFAPLLSRLLGSGIDLALSVRPSLLEELPRLFSFSANKVIRL